MWYSEISAACVSTPVTLYCWEAQHLDPRPDACTEIPPTRTHEARTVFASLLRFGLASGHHAAPLTSGRAVHRSYWSLKYLWRELNAYIYGTYRNDNTFSHNNLCTRQCKWLTRTQKDKFSCYWRLVLPFLHKIPLRRYWLLLWWMDSNGSECG